MRALKPGDKVQNWHGCNGVVKGYYNVGLMILWDEYPARAQMHESPYEHAAFISTFRGDSLSPRELELLEALRELKDQTPFRLVSWCKECFEDDDGLKNFRICGYHRAAALLKRYEDIKL